jgi:hypothetical protein
LVLGDEGDIGVDSRDYVYYVDTTLLDINIHVFANQGEWQYSNVIQKASKELDHKRSPEIYDPTGYTGKWLASFGY